jgi:N-acylneuraminate cytidylyltransferase/CMP-N,N'-diacetyllegionaminic acid synthase
MYKDKKILAIIPARGDSKRLKNKNIKLLGGKPLISWSIDSAKKSKYIDDVLVTSDSVKIIEIANQYHSDITINRPSSLAQDTAKSIDVVTHAIQCCIDKGKHYDYVILLQPTSPLRDTMHIDKAIKYLFDKKSDAIISTCECEHSPLWSNKLCNNYSMENFLPSNLLNLQSQELETYYRLNGAIYICDINKLLKENTFFIKKNIYAFVMEQIDSVDIDTKLDFLLAETILKEKNE